MNEQEFIDRTIAAERTLYRMAYLMLKSPQDREDAVQEAILRAWRGRARLREARYFETWLVRILINECRRLRGAGVHTEPLDLNRAVYTDSPEPDLHRAIGSLEEKYRLPVILMYIEGYTAREIASILRVPQGTVAWRLRRALAILKTQLEVDIDEEPSFRPGCSSDAR